MRSNKLIYYSTSFAAFFLSVFMIGSINQSTVNQEKTVTNEPTVVSTFPSDGDTDVPRNVVIEITFSEEVDSMAMNNSTFTLMQGTESVEGTLEYSDKKGMFTTQNSLKAESEYTAKLTTVSSQSNDDFSNEEYNDEEFNNEESEYRTSLKNDNGKEWSFTTGGNSDPVETVDLGSAADYVILAHTSINNDTSSEITGEKGFDPNFKSSKDKDNKTAYWLNNEDVDKEAVRRDTTHKKSDNREYTKNDRDSDKRESNAGNLDKALEDMITAFDDAAERSPVDFLDYKFVQSDDQDKSAWKDNRVDDNEMNLRDSTDTKDSTDVRVKEDYNAEHMMEEDHNAEHAMDMNSNESSVTLEPGIYKWNDSVEISTNITLSGSAEDVWIFQIPEGLTVNRDVEVTLSDGAVAEHIFWQVGGDVNIGESAHIEGIILSLTGITMKNGASLNGRILAQTDVTLDDNTITEPQFLASAQRTSLDEK